MAQTAYTLPHNLFSVPDISPERGEDAVSGHGNVPVFIHPYHSEFDAHELIAIASALVSPRGKGIYATDESPDAMVELLNAASGEDPKVVAKQFTEEQNKERRKKWRESVYNAAPSGQLHEPLPFINGLNRMCISTQSTSLE